VDVDLVVRGTCALRPGVPGLSDRIRVRSILGRFLEHSRVFHFGGDGAPEYWLGSADMMHRNLDRRVEVLVRITDDVARGQLERLLDLATGDDVACWELQPDGSWLRRTEQAEQELHDYQVTLTRLHTGYGDTP
jgi:polyphosphate kinase